MDVTIGGDRFVPAVAGFPALELIEEEMEYQRLHGYIRVTAEAVELCEQCQSEGSIVSICDACGGRIGIPSSFKRGRGAKTTSTQLHLRAAS